MELDCQEVGMTFAHALVTNRNFYRLLLL